MVSRSRAGAETGQAQGDVVHKAPDCIVHRTVRAEALDLPYGMQGRGVMPIAELTADLLERRQ